MDTLLQLITASLTLLSVRMAGNGDQRFNWVGLGNQILWIIVILRSQTFGLLILTAAMVYMYTKNLIKNDLLNLRAPWKCRPIERSP